MPKNLLVGNCLDTLKTIPDNSIDSIVTDPPYEIGFMGNGWDSTGIAYNVELWRECLRVLKPGGHLLSFGATRSYHRMAVAIEDAGFEIRDSIHWTYGSGFPKSMNVGKALDKAAGAEREVVGTKRVSPKGVSAAETRSDVAAGSYGGEAKDVPVTAPSTDAAKKWDGWGTALKPSHEPIVVARKPLAGTVAANVLEYGTGALNIDASRIGTTGARNNGNSNETVGSNSIDVYGKAIKQDYNMGRFPANTLLTHAADCVRVGFVTDQPSAGKRTATFGEQETVSGGDGSGGWSSSPVTTPTWQCAPSCPVPLLDQQSGVSRGTERTGHPGGTTFGGGAMGESVVGTWFGDKGGASRFFSQTEWSEADDLAPFIYQAKPGKKERNAGLDALESKRQDEDDYERAGTTNPRNHSQLERKNFHPTVKPVELMRHLIRMVTPPGGTVLDPFLGSGTTAVAAELEGFTWNGCELTEEYLPIINGRVKWAKAERKRLLKAAKGKK